ncbi:MAG: ATP-binding protein [Chlamydiae bacterium]|nr:ATP-binding protein [Chlamydiota bacterium]
MRKSGARQTGKSTLLTRIFPQAKAITFDPIQDLFEVRKDPDQFLQLFPSPLILDEVQFVPELLSSLKRKVDQTEQMGQYFLTGSQNFQVLSSLAESMAGRVAIFHLDPFSPLEMQGLGEHKSWVVEYLRDPQAFFSSKHAFLSLPSLPEFLLRGGYPRATILPMEQLETFFLSYIQTYVERDVRLLENIEDLRLFGDFLRLAATSTAQEINASQLGRELNISSQTARKWLNLLLYTYQWIEIPPYHGNTIKRISEKRKGYYKDTGIACHLMRLFSPESLVSSLKLGSIFETWSINHLIQEAGSANAYHWRSHGGAEVDLLLERNGCFFPIEIKSKSRPGKADISGIKAFRETYPSLQIAPGIVFHAGEENYPIDIQTFAVSWKTY